MEEAKCYHLLMRIAGTLMIKSLSQINASVNHWPSRMLPPGMMEGSQCLPGCCWGNTSLSYPEWGWVGTPYLWHPCFLSPVPHLPWLPCLLPPCTVQFECTRAAGAPGCIHCAEKTWSTFSWDVGRARAEAAPLLGYGCLLLSQQERKEQVGVRKQFFSYCCMSNRLPIVLFTLLANSKILVPGGFCQVANILGDSDSDSIEGRNSARLRPLQPWLLFSTISPLFDILIFKKTRRMPETAALDRLRLSMQFP